MSAAQYARKAAAATKDASPTVRRLALEDALRARGRELGLSIHQVDKVVTKARDRAVREWGY